MSKIGAPKNASLSLLTFCLSSNRLSSLLRLCCSCAVFVGRGFQCFASFACCVCAAIATDSRVSSFNDFICVAVGGCFPARFETHRVRLLVLGILVWTRAYVAARSCGRDGDMRANFRYWPQQEDKIRHVMNYYLTTRNTHLLVVTYVESSRVKV